MPKPPIIQIIEVTEKSTGRKYVGISTKKIVNGPFTPSDVTRKIIEIDNTAIYSLGGPRWAHIHKLLDAGEDVVDFRGRSLRLIVGKAAVTSDKIVLSMDQYNDLLSLIELNLEALEILTEIRK